MEWRRPRRSCGRLTDVVALLILMLLIASARRTSAAAAVAVDEDVATDPGSTRRRAGVSKAAGEAASLCASLHGDDIMSLLPVCDTMRTNAGTLARGNSSAEPTGDKKLIIAVPHNHVFEKFVNFAIDVFMAAREKLPTRPCYELCSFPGTYDELVGNVSEGVFDGAVGDITITAERAQRVDFTMPYTPSGVSLLVLAADDSKPTIQWIFLKPLTGQLWLTTVVFFFLTGLVVWMIERPRNTVYQGTPLRQCSTALYFAFSTLTFSHGQAIKSPLSKVIVVIWCFAVLVLVQSYTANLSSMLTAKRLRPSVTGLDQLLNNTSGYIGYQQGTFVHDFLIKKGFQATKLRALKDPTEYATALRNGSKNGGVSAIVDEKPYLSSFLAETGNKKDFEITTDRLYDTPGLAFVFPKGCELVHNLSIAILNVIGGTESSEIQKKWFPTATQVTADDSNQLTLRSFSGLFLITGCVSASMLFISIARSVYTKYTRLRGSELQRYHGNDGNVRTEEFSPLQDDTGTGSELDQHLQEVRDSDSGDASGGDRSAGDVEAGPMQESMPNGSVPEVSVSVQIEMSSSGQGVGRVLQ